MVDRRMTDAYDRIERSAGDLIRFLRNVLRANVTFSAHLYAVGVRFC